MTVDFVTFAPNEKWVVVRDDGRSVSWPTGLPQSVFDFLDKRYLTNTNGSPLVALGIGVNYHYAAFCRNGKWEVNDDGIYGWLDEHGYGGADIKWVSFGTDSYGDSTYFIWANDGRMQWTGGNYRFGELLKTKTNTSLRWADIGPDDSYVLVFNDGSLYWSANIDTDLSEVLDKESSVPVTKVFLSVDCTSSWYVEWSDGATQWNGQVNLRNNLEQDARLDPQPILYSNGSIASEFSCGRSLTSVIEDLNDGSTDVDDIPAMHVVKFRGNTYSLNNRRLYVFTMAEVRLVPVVWKSAPAWLKKKINRQHFTGMNINVRGSSSCYSANVYYGYSDSSSD